MKNENLKLVRNKPIDTSYLPTPKNFDEYIGQEHAKKLILALFEGCRLSNAIMPHMLFTGPSGGGKTEIVRITTEKIGAVYHRIMVTPDLSECDFLHLVDKAEEKYPDKLLVFHLDEAHNLNNRLTEMFYSFIETSRLPRSADEFDMDPLVTRKIQNLVVIFSGNKPGAIKKELRNRLISIELDDYSFDELKQILLQGSRKKGLSIDEKAIEKLVLASQSVPRTGLMLLKEISLFSAGHKIDLAIIDNFFSLKKISSTGFSYYHMKMLNFLFKQPGYTARLGVLASILGIDTKLIQHTIEPTLLRKHLITTTTMGRKLTRKGVDFIAETVS